MLAKCFENSERQRLRSVGLHAYVLAFVAVTSLIQCSPTPGGAGQNDNDCPSGSNGGQNGECGGESAVPELTTNDRGLPDQLSSDSLTARFVWSADATQASVRIDEDGQSTTVDLTLDFADSSLIESLDLWSSDTGESLEDLRGWIADHPGRVQETVSGTASSAADAQRISGPSHTAKRQTLLQDNEASELEEYLDGLYLAILSVQRTIAELSAARIALEDAGSPATGVVGRLMQHFIELRDFLYQDLQDQVHECAFCTSRCRRSCPPVATGVCCNEPGTCTEDANPFECENSGGRFYTGTSCAQLDQCRSILGACCTRDESGHTGCDEVTLGECQSRNGIYSAGSQCSGSAGADVPGAKDPCTAACCVTTTVPGGGSLSCCVDLYPEECESVEAGGTNVTVEFTQGIRCGDPRLSCPICN